MAHDPSPNYEGSGVATSAVLGSVFGFMAFAALALFGLAAWYSSAGVNLFSPPRAFPAPRLETRNAEDFAGLMATQRARATHYAWVDRKSGVIRIPIARAMEILAARGATAYDPPDPPPAVASAPP